MTSKDKPFVNIGCRTKIFSLGIIIGCLGGLIWQELFSPLEISPKMDREQQIQILKEDTNEKLLNYIEGTWTSSIGDLIISIDESKVEGLFTVIEQNGSQAVSKKFKIFNIETIDGFFGIVKLNICDQNKPCNQENSLPIQINKVFGIDRTITISFDKRVSYCVNIEELCTRAFKRLN